MTDVWSMIAAERRGLADELQDLSDEQWATPSLCAGWMTRDVLAHLLMPFRLSLPKLLLKLAGNGFDFNKLSDEFARADARPVAELLAQLRANAEHRFKPPGFGPEAPLTDAVVHGQDIRRPLGLAHTIPPDHARVVLDLVTSPKGTKAFGKKGLLTGLSVEVPELDWTYGSGDVITGPAEAMIMTLTGRRGMLDELSGPGVGQLSRR